RDRNVTGVQTCALPILTDDRRISAIQRIIHPRVQRVVEVLVVDDSGRALLAITRVARTARRDDDFSEALPVLAVVALIALIALRSEERRVGNASRSEVG